MFSWYREQLSQPPIGDHERHMQFVIRERVRGLKLPASRARGMLLSDLAKELRQLRETYDSYKFGKYFALLKWIGFFYRKV